MIDTRIKTGSGKAQAAQPVGINAPAKQRTHEPEIPRLAGNVQRCGKAGACGAAFISRTWLTRNSTGLPPNAHRGRQPQRRVNARHQRHRRHASDFSYVYQLKVYKPWLKRHLLGFKNNKDRVGKMLYCLLNFNTIRLMMELL